MRATAVTASRARPRAGVVVVLVVVALVSAVVFHVALAQGQLELDRLDDRIAAQRLEYERLRLEVATLASPQRVIEQAEALGFVIPDEPRTYLEVPGAPVPGAGAVDAATTIAEWEDVKPHLGDDAP